MAGPHPPAPSPEGRRGDVPLLIAVMGATASGKTPLAERLAKALDAQLINADAFQVYRGLDIGTAKPTDKSKYHLLDIKHPTEEFGVGEFVGLAAQILSELFAKGRNAVVVGGTGLNIRALFQGYSEMRPLPDPELRQELTEIQSREGMEGLAKRLREADPAAASKVDLKNPARVRRALEKAIDPRPSIKLELPPFHKVKVALDPSAEALSQRIHQRVGAMVQNGWVEEVRRLMGEGIPKSAPGLRAIGYRALYGHLEGIMALDAALEGIRTETRQYAKRQRTWLRSEPNLRVLEGELTTEHAIDMALRIIEAPT